MNINDLIKEFEEECLFGEDRVKNIILYDVLLDKINREEKFKWNLDRLRSFLSIIWYRLKKECPIANAYFDKNGASPVAKKTEKIVIKSDDKGIDHIAVFNTNLKDKYYNDIYCLGIRNENNKLLLISASNSFPFYTKKEFELELQSDLSKSDLSEKDEIKKAIDEIINIIKTDFNGKLPSIELPRIDFSDENHLEIQINEPYRHLMHNIDSSMDTRKNRLSKFFYTEKEKGFNKRKSSKTDKDKEIGAELKHQPESKLSGWDHIIIDGSDNLPLKLLNMLFDRPFYFLDKYRTQIDIIENPSIYESLKILIERAIIRSWKRASERNYIAKTYYIDKDHVSYLLPLYILQREEPDCVLVFNKDKKNGERFIGATLLSIEEARIDARVLGKIDDYKWMFES